MFGFSVGAGACLRAAIQHPDLATVLAEFLA